MSYLDGCDILGADVTIPTEGAVYNDSATVFSVQTALKAKGFNPGAIDGVYGPNTSKAIKAMQTAAGLPATGVVDYGVLMALGVTVPPVSSTPPSRIATSRSSYVPSAFNGSYAQIIPQAGTAASPADGLLAAPPSFWSKPLWEGSPIKVGQAIFGGAAGLAFAVGVVVAVKK